MTEQCGVDFLHETGRYGDTLLPETMGSGVAVLDYNNDGHCDLLLVNSSRWDWDQENQEESPCKLYEGDGNFGFTGRFGGDRLRLHVLWNGGRGWRLRQRR